MPGQGHFGANCVCYGGCYWEAPHTLNSLHILLRLEKKKAGSEVYIVLGNVSGKAEHDQTFI